MADADTSTRLKAFDIIMGILQAISLSLAGWMLYTIVAHGERLSAIEASRYTSRDAMEAEKATAAATLATWQEITRLWTAVTMKADATNVPPPEVVRFMDRTEARISVLEVNMQRSKQP